MERFIGKDAWFQLDDLTRNTIGAIALELVANMWALDRSYDPDSGTHKGHEALGRAAERADDLLMSMLERAAFSALPQTIVGPEAPPRLASLVGPVCRVCGCSENDACEGGCCWTAPDRCSACTPQGVF